MPFNTVLDAYTGMSVCAAPDPQIPPTVDTLDVYAGYIAYPIDPGADLSLRLGNTELVMVSLRVFENGAFASETTAQIAPGTPLFVPQPVAFSQMFGWTTVVALLAFIAAAGANALRKTKSPAPR